MFDYDEWSSSKIGLLYCHTEFPQAIYIITIHKGVYIKLLNVDAKTNIAQPICCYKPVEDE